MENNQYKDLPKEIIRRYTQEELDKSFNTLIGRVNITHHLFYNKSDRLKAFSDVIIDNLISYLDVDFSHRGNNKNARLYRIFFDGLLELYKDRIADHYNTYEKYYTEWNIY
jgi:hypothetical protein